MANKLDYDAFLKVVRSRRNCRKFKPDPIPDEYVKKILEAGRWAMSGANGQPWEFIVIKDQKTKDKIAELAALSRQRVFDIERTRVEELRMPAYRQRPTQPPSLQAAPVVIAVVGDRRTLQASVLYSNFVFGEGGPGACYFKNMGNATQLLCLAAASLGLGAQWSSVTSSWEDSLKRLLKVPEELSIPTLVPIGYPDYKNLRRLTAVNFPSLSITSITTSHDIERVRTFITFSWSCVAGPTRLTLMEYNSFVTTQADRLWAVRKKWGFAQLNRPTKEGRRRKWQGL